MKIFTLIFIFSILLINLFAQPKGGTRDIRSTVTSLKGTNNRVVVADPNGRLKTLANGLDEQVLMKRGGILGFYSLTTSGATNLGYTASPTDGLVTSDTGSDATIPAGSIVNASLMLPTDKVKLNGITSGANYYTFDINTNGVVDNMPPYSIFKLTSGANITITRNNAADLTFSAAGSNLSYNASTRVLSSSNGTSTTLPLVDGSNAGLMSSIQAANLATAYAWGNHAGLYEFPLTFSTGLSRVGNTITNTVTQYTDALARASISLTTNGSSGAATYNSSTGILNIPQYAGGSGMIWPTGTGIPTVVNGNSWGNTIPNGAGFLKNDGTGVWSYDNSIYDRYLRWNFSVDGISPTPINSQETLDFQAGSGITLTRLVSGDTKRITISASGGGGGTVTSVGLSAPTGFSVSGSPVTSSGTLTFSYASGYSLPTTASQLTWNDAYSNMGKTSTDGSFFSYLNPNYFNALGGWKPTTLSEPTPFSDKPFSAGGAYTALTAKQDALNGTGFVKISGTTISYDNNSYALLNGSLSQDFSGRSFLLPNSINVNGNDGIARLVNGGHSFALFSNGDASVDGIFTASELYRGSSKELKHNIKPYKGNALDILNATKIYTYNLNSDNSFGVGFLAEDTHKWLSGENQKSHAMGNHLGLLTKAIQEQIIVIEEMQKQISDLQIEIKKLKKRQLKRK